MTELELAKAEASKWKKIARDNERRKHSILRTWGSIREALDELYELSGRMLDDLDDLAEEDARNRRTDRLRAAEGMTQ